MFVIEEQDSILVYDKSGRLVNKILEAVSYKKFNEESLVVITEESVEFISQLKRGKEYDITTVSDTNYERAIIYEELVLIQRKIVFPILDVYNSDMMNVLRLYQDTKGSWVYFIVKYGVPTRKFTPYSIDGSMVYGKRKSKKCSYNLATGEYKENPSIKPLGLPIKTILNKFEDGGQG